VPLPGAGALLKVDLVAAYVGIPGMITVNGPSSGCHLHRGYDPIGVALLVKGASIAQTIDAPGG